MQTNANDVRNVSKENGHTSGECDAPALTVLAVDDDRGDCELIRRALRQCDDVGAVIVRRSGEAALGDLATNQVTPDVILLDLRMPCVNGFTFMRHLRAIRKMRNVPVIMLTTSKLSSDQERAEDVGVVEYIVKPDDLDEWRVRMERVMARVKLHVQRDRALQGAT